MVEIQHKYWSGATEFINADAKRLLPEMIRYDENNKSELNHNINLALSSHDKGLAQFITVLQKLYQNKKKWENTPNTRAAVAMANSALNYHLLARHTIVLGYPTETEPIHRACFERMTRCAVFQLEEDLAQKFWKGKQIRQKQIDKLLSKDFENKATGVGEIANKVIRNMYGNLSQVSHPNLKVLRLRTIKPIDKDEGDVGIDFSYCGENQELLKLMSIGESMTYVIFSLFMMVIVAKKVFGSWANVLESKIEKLFEEQDTLFAHIMTTMRKLD